MAAYPYFKKDPSDVIDVIFDWSVFLAGDTIATSTTTVAAGLTKNSESNTTQTATIWLSGGTAGTNYTVVNTITTAGGRTFQRTLQVNVEDL
jgi:hypothetical protein